MAIDRSDTPIPPRFVQGTAVRVRPPWQKTAKATARSRSGFRVVADNSSRDRPDETKD
ncbi:hypothetical protein V5F53_18755 [Xanthobacter sp. V4C-4]|uniref:hypothetical protein n=1 Tax=Xanthobacter cornucopiae TaxID=3119924 RepID=UPI00372C0AE0